MVQGGSSTYVTRNPCEGQQWDNSARKAGFEALQKKEQQRQEAQRKQQYSAWGPTFKNKQAFTDMHHC